MKKNLVVLSKSKAKEFECEEPWVCISIDSYDEHPRISGVKRLGLLRCSFADIDSAHMAPHHGHFFNEEDANQIWDFVESFWERDDITTIMVHCQAGISRSAATAAAIENCLNEENPSRFWEGRFHPNMHVFSTLVDVFHQRKGWEPARERMKKLFEKDDETYLRRLRAKVNETRGSTDTT